VLFLDNQKFVHYRTEIQDSSRCILRVRFDFEKPPELERVLSAAVKKGQFSSMSDIVLPMQKHRLLSVIQDNFDTLYSAGGLYWSPSGGSTTGSMPSERCAIPTAIGENTLMRNLLRDQLRLFGAISKISVNVNLMPFGNLYRTMEIFAEIFVGVGATDLPLGPEIEDANILNIIRRFGPNTMCGLSSRLLQLVMYAANSEDKSVLKTISVIVFAGEPMTFEKRAFIESFCAPDCKTFGVFGSAEVGVFACTNGNKEEDDVYYVLPDAVHIEIVDECFQPVSNGCEGVIVATNLLRISAVPICRYYMDDRAIILPRQNKVVDTCVRIKLTGRSEGAITFSLGNMHLRWCDISSDILSNFNALGQNHCLASQLWITPSTKHPLKDALTLAIVLSDNPHNSLGNDTETLASAVEDATRKLASMVQAVPNIEEVCVKTDCTISQLVTSKRSGKLLFFVDLRSS